MNEKRVSAGLSLASDYAIERLRLLAQSEGDLDQAEVVAELRHVAEVLKSLAESFQTVVSLLAEIHDGTIIDTDTEQDRRVGG